MKNTKKIFFLLVIALIVMSWNGTFTFAAFEIDDTEDITYYTPTNREENKGIATVDEGIKPRAIITLPSTASNAMAITSYPYQILNCSMVNGTAGYIKYTPTYNAYYTIYTTGSLDTYIEAYNNVSLSMSVGNNDDDGASLNACLTLYLNSGTTYYFKVRGYSSSTNGNYNLIFHRGLAMSGYEIVDNFSIYNSTTYKEYNNCYTYAINKWTHPVTGYKYGYRGINPGGIANQEIKMSDLANATIAYNSILTACKADFAKFGGDFRPIGKYDQPSPNYFKVALVLAPNQDYHWYRQTSDGKWAHKPGVTEAKYSDNSNNYIFLPDECDRGIYTAFLGYFEVKTGAILGRTADVPLPNEVIEEVNIATYQYKYDISLTEFDTFDKYMTVDAVKALVGEAHANIGSGMIGDIYFLNDGTDVVIYYSNGTVDQIRVLNVDGSYDIILQ